MGYPQKIVTCCYCGTRAALILKGRERHELACSSCGAPLHDLKMLPKDRSGDRELLPRPKPSPKKSARAPGFALPNVRFGKALKKSKKRKSKFKDLFEDAFDLIEDIFD